ncbi:MAG TPA: hypothetical protein VNY36_00540 [Bacteroidia bacterium]|jgi:hypothetical protein|nr:hypothetical protein [Bacteroidia bacterium]
MSTDRNAYTLTLKPAKKMLIWLLPNLLLSLAALFFSYCYSSFTDFTSPSFIWTVVFVFVAIMSINTFINVIWVLTGKETITVDKSTLTARRVTGGFSKEYVYQLAEVNELTLVVNEETNTNFRIPLRANSIVISSYKNPIVLYFNYSGTRKRIGNYCAEFPADELRAELYKKMGKHE